jgi:hypothetical protein
LVSNLLKYVIRLIVSGPKRVKREQRITAKDVIDHAGGGPDISCKSILFSQAQMEFRWS